METVAIKEQDIEQGADYAPPSLKRRFTSAAVRQAGCAIIDTCSGQPIAIDDLATDDFTGCTATMTLRKCNASGDVLATLTTANGGISLFPDGVLKWRLSAAQTATMQPGLAFGQIDVTWPSGEVARFYEITATVKKGGN